ncbi:caspase family protein [Streptomyces sp. NPDC058637]|uniref:caspase, EACC1-associated type n=1 Tax=Streptomyces sp. NPDC058637 TaxID=3346569 RepID=UPI00365B2C2C
MAADPDAGEHLTGPDCHAVVIGTGQQPAGARLSDLPSATRSAAALAETLRTVCGMATDQVRLVTDPAGPTDVLAAVSAAVDRAEGGVVVLSFTGHGLLGPGDQLYLATSATASANDTVHAVPYAEIRNLLSAAPVRPVVILDCCFSGLAEAAPQGPRGNPYVSARPDGSFLLASATHYAASFAPEGEEYTLFGGALLRLLREGDAGGPKWLTLADVYRHLDRRLQAAPARPHSDTVGRMGDLVLAANPRYAATDDPGRDLTQGPAPALRARDEGPCPYPGMRPFLPEQRHLFFGREELTRALLDRVTGSSADAGLPVVLVGPSGVGKSSLLRAGLGAALGPGGPGPALLVAAPGDHPFRTLTARWAEAVGQPFGEVERALGAGRFVPPADGRRAPGVLVIDQLEEIFTHCEDAEERELFIRAVTGEETSQDTGDDTGAAHQGSHGPQGSQGSPDPRTAAGTDTATGTRAAVRPRIVLGLRADYFGQCLRDPRLSRVVRAGQFTVLAMTRDELRSAIERPAALAGLRLEDGLSALLLRELHEARGGAGDAVALPFLAHALQETWAARRGTLLTFAGYQATGGIGSSVARAAEHIHASLDAEGRSELRELCLRMVRLVDGHGKAVRRRVRTEELAGGEALLGRLADARLVVVDDGEAQLCHDSLLYGWPRLRHWINADLDGLLVRRRLGEAADAWAETGRPPSGLYAGRHLAAARSLARDDTRLLPMRPVERDFLGASGAAERRKKKLLASGVVMVLVLALVATTLAFVARRAQTDAEARETLLIARQVAAQADIMRERDPRTALRMSLAAYRTAPTPETRSSLYSAYTTLAPVDIPARDDGAVLNIAFSPDGRTLVTSQAGGRVRLWDISRPGVPREAAAMDLGKAAVIAFHPREPLLAVQTEKRLTVWDTADPGKPKRLAERTTAEETAYTLAFSPDGRTLASGSGKGRLRLWDLVEPARPQPRTERTETEEALISLAFSPDGRLLITGNGVGGPKGEIPGQVRLWDVRDPDRPALLSLGTAASVQAVSFHPRRDLVVAAGAKGTLAWWKLEGERRLEPVAAEDYERTWGVSYGVPSISFRADGTVLAAASAGGHLLLRDVGESDSSLYRLGGQTQLPAAEPVQAVAHSRDGTLVAAGDVKGAVRLWPAKPSAPSVKGTLAYPDPGTRAVSDDGRFMITTVARDDYTSSTHVWDLKDAAAPRRAFDVPEAWQARYFLPGRRTPVLLAHRYTSGSQKHDFRLWEFGPDGEPVPGEVMSIRTADVVTAVSADGARLAIGTANGRRIELWDVGDTHAPVRRGVIDAPVEFSQGGLWFAGRHTLVTTERGAGDRSDLRLWDVTDPAHPRRAGSVKDGALGESGGFLHSSNLLVVEKAAEDVRLWDLSDVDRPTESDIALPSSSGGYYPAGPDILMTVLSDGRAQFWDVRDPRRPERVRSAMRFDRPVATIAMSPDGSRAVTGSPYRIWAVGPHGRWHTPSLATLDTAARVEFLPDERPFMAVVPDSDVRGVRDTTFLLPLDTDGIYDELCRTHPTNIDRAQWESLLPHIEYRRSCD